MAAAASGGGGAGVAAAGSTKTITIFADGGVYLVKGNKVWTWKDGGVCEGPETLAEKWDISFDAPDTATRMIAGRGASKDRIGFFQGDKFAITRDWEKDKDSSVKQDCGPWPISEAIGLAGPYPLSAALTFSTELPVYFFKGKNLFKENRDTKKIEYCGLATSTFGVEDNITGAAMTEDGKTLYLMTGEDGETFHPFSLSTPFDITTRKREATTTMHRYFQLGRPGKIVPTLAMLGKYARHYVFRGTNYYRLDAAGEFCDPDYPRHIRAWGFDFYLDAAMMWNERVYLFAGPHYWRLNATSDAIDPGYPLRITEWGLPGPITAAVQVGKTTLFFKGREWYQLNEPGTTVVAHGDVKKTFGIDEEVTGAFRNYCATKLYLMTGWNAENCHVFSLKSHADVSSRHLDEVTPTHKAIPFSHKYDVVDGIKDAGKLLAMVALMKAMGGPKC